MWTRSSWFTTLVGFFYILANSFKISFFFFLINHSERAVNISYNDLGFVCVYLQFCSFLFPDFFFLQELCCCFPESESHLVVSDSLQPHGLYSPWHSPGQNSGLCSLSFLQWIFPTHGSNLGLWRDRRIRYQGRCTYIYLFLNVLFYIGM